MQSWDNLSARVSFRARICFLYLFPLRELPFWWHFIAVCRSLGATCWYFIIAWIVFRVRLFFFFLLVEFHIIGADCPLLIFWWLLTQTYFFSGIPFNFTWPFLLQNFCIRQIIGDWVFSKIATKSRLYGISSSVHVVRTLKIIVQFESRYFYRNPQGPLNLLFPSSSSQYARMPSMVE